MISSLFHVKHCEITAANQRWELQFCSVSGVLVRQGFRCGNLEVSRETHMMHFYSHLEVVMHRRRALAGTGLLYEEPCNQAEVACSVHSTIRNAVDNSDTTRKL